MPRQGSASGGMRRAAIYARVSTGEQTCENQLHALQLVAERNCWMIGRAWTRPPRAAGRSFR